MPFLAGLTFGGRSTSVVGAGCVGSLVVVGAGFDGSARTGRGCRVGATELGGAVMSLS